MSARSLSIGFVVPYGERGPSFFADSLPAHLCHVARELGHRAEIAHVYYDGRDAQRDAEIGARLERWLADRACDLVVMDRLFDPAPIRAHVSRDPARHGVFVCRGDSFDGIEGIDVVVGAVPGRTRTAGTRRTATIPELRRAFAGTLRALSCGDDPGAVPGVSRTHEGRIIAGPPLDGIGTRARFGAVVEHDVIALDPAPKQTHKTLFGNAGCPYSADPLENEHFRGLALDDRVARLGCAFCAMGGDYEKQPDQETIPSLVEQASFWASRLVEVEAFVLDDQSPLRYLPSLIRAAHAAGVRPVRWLFAARPDRFVRDRARVEAAIAAARETGQRVEVYLSGFESFSDAELARYNKGLRTTDLLAAIGAMRELAIAHPDQFAYADARGHSLILWSPWTTPDDLRESAANIRAAGARELFHELGKNRLRLYDDLPIRFAAERDGALVDRWEGSDEGEARRKGYNVEQPWRFLDRRTRLAHALAGLLRRELGRESELAQLSAVSQYSARLDAAVDVDATVARVGSGLAALIAAFREIASGGGKRARTTRADAVSFAGACNNGCTACANRDRFLDDRFSGLAERVDRARKRGRPLLFAGREPTLHPSFLDLLSRARGDDGRAVAVVTNGRLLSYRAFARRARQAGLTGASVKLFAPDATLADEIARVPGAHEQALAGIRALRAEAIRDLEIRAPLHDTTLEGQSQLASVACSLSVDAIRIECALDALDLDRLEVAAESVRRLRGACASAGVTLEAAPLSAATTAFEWYPG